MSWKKLLTEIPPASDIASSPATGKVLKVGSSGALEWATDAGGSFTTSGTVASFIGTKTSVQTQSSGASGSVLELLKDSPSPANNDAIGQIEFTGNVWDSSESELDGNNVFGLIKAIATNVESGSESGKIDFQTYTAGSNATRLSISDTITPSSHIIPSADNTIDLGSTTDKDFRMLYTRGIDIYNERLKLGYYNLKATYKDHASVGDGHEFSHRGTVAMQIGKPSSTSPYVGIGTTNPGSILPSGFGSGNLLEIKSASNTDSSGLLLTRLDGATASHIWHNGASHDMYIDNKWTNDDADIFLRTKGSSTRMTIKGSGNIGIGNTAPDELLHIKQTGNDFTTIKVESTANHADAGSNIQLTSDDGSSWFVNHSTSRTISRYGHQLGGYTEILGQDSANGLAIGTGTTNTKIIFGVNNTEKMTIKSEGVGVGTNAPSTQFHVKADATGNYASQIINVHSNGLGLMVRGGASSASNIVLGLQNSTQATVWKAHLDGSTYQAGFADVANLKIAGGQGTDGQVLTSTGSGVAWEDSSDGGLWDVAGGIEFTTAGNKTITHQVSEADIHFAIRKASSVYTIMTLDGSDQRVGIGTTSPSSTLHVQGTGLIKNSGADSQFIVEAPGGYDARLILKSDAGGANEDWWQFRADNDQKLYIRNGNTDLHALTSDGKLGIGVTSPAEKLQVDGSVRISENSWFDWGGTGSRITGQSSYIQIQTGSTDVIRINNSQNVGIGTTSPLQKLHVNGIIQTSSELRSSSGNGLYLQALGTSGGFTHRFQDNGTDRMVINSSGNIGIGTSPTSLLHLKKDGIYDLTLENADGSNWRSGIKGRGGASGTQTGFALAVGRGTGIECTGASVFDTYLTTTADEELHFGTNNTVRMTIDGGTGNVGIGITNPVHKAQVWGDMASTTLNLGTKDATGNPPTNSSSTQLNIETYGGAGRIKVRRTGYAEATIEGNSVSAQFGSSSNHPVTFYANGSEKMKLTTAGTLGIGDSSATYSANTKIDVRNGAIQSSSFYVGGEPYQGTIAYNGNGNIIHTPRDGYDIQFNLGNNQGLIVADGLMANAGASIAGTSKTSGGMPVHIKDAEPHLIIEGTSSSQQWWGVSGASSNSKLMHMILDSSTQVMKFESVNDDGSAKKQVIAFDGHNGRVGIGTVTPGGHGEQLEVYGNGVNTSIKIHEDAGSHEAKLHLRRGGSDWEIINNGDLAIEIEDAEKFRIKTTGNVGIGVTDPGEELDVEGDIRIRNTIHSFATSNRGFTRPWMSFNEGQPLYKTSTTSHYHSFQTYDGVNATTVMSVGGANNRVGISCIPSAKLELTETNVNSDGIKINKSGTQRSLYIDHNMNIGTGITSDGIFVDYDKTQATTGGTAHIKGVNIAVNDATDSSSGTTVNTTGLRVAMNIAGGTKSGTHNNYSATFTGGNVGIDTESPGSHLHIRGTTPQIRLQNDGQSNYLAMYHIAGHARMFVEGSGKLTLGAGGNGDRLRIGADGKIGVNLDASETFEIGVSSDSDSLSFYRGTVVDNNALGKIKFKGNNGTEAHTYSQIHSICGNFEDGAEYSDVVISGSNGSAGLEEIARFYARQLLMTNSGSKIGIRTASPAEALDVHGTLQVSRVGAPTSNAIQLFGGSGSSYPYMNVVGEHFEIRTAGTQRFKFNATGLGIGTMSPGYPLEINKSTDGAMAGLTIKNTAGGSSSINETSEIYLQLNNGSNSSTSTSKITVGKEADHMTASDVDTYMAFSTVLDDATNERMRIKANGHVGIGLNNPTSQLHLKGTGTISQVQSTNTVAYQYFYTSSTGVGSNDGLTIGVNGVNGVFNNRESGSLIFGTSDTTRLTIQSNGWASFTEPITLATTKALYFDGGDNTFIRENGADTLQFYTGGTNRLQITSAGKVGIGTTDPGNDSMLDVRGRISVREASELQLGTHADYTFLEGFDTSSDRAPKKPINLNPWGGNIGIGITAPEENLHINSANATTGLMISNSATDGDPYLVWRTTGNTTWAMGIDDGDNDVLAICQSNNLGSGRKVTINQSGKVGIAITNPVEDLHVAGSVKTGNVIVGDSYGAKGIFGANAQGNTDPGAMHFSASNVNTTNSAYIKVASGNTGDNATKGHIDLVAGYYSGSSMTGDIRFWTGANGNQKRLEISNNGNIDFCNQFLKNWNAMESSGGLYFDNAGYIDNRSASGDLVFRTTASITQRMKIKSNGNVGIGVEAMDDIDYRLDVDGAIRVSDAIYGFHDGGGSSGRGYARKWTQYGPNVIHHASATDRDIHFFADQGTDKPVLKVGGGTGYTRRVGINTLTPACDLHVKSPDAHASIKLESGSVNHQTYFTMEADRPSENDTIANIQFTVAGTLAGAITAIRGDADNKADIAFHTTNTERMRIYDDGNIKMGTDGTTNAPRGLFDVRGANHNQGFYVNAGSVGLPTDIVHSGGAGTFDIQVRNYRLGTNGGGDCSIYPKYAGNDIAIGTASFINFLRIDDTDASVHREKGKLETALGADIDDSVKVIDYIGTAITTDANTQEIFLNGTSTRMVIPTDATWFFKVNVVARQIENGVRSAGYSFEGALQNENDTVTLVGATTTCEEEGVSGWNCSVVADDTNNSLKVQVKNNASNRTHWVAEIHIVQTKQ